MLPLNVKTYIKTTMALEQKKVLSMSKLNFQSAGNYTRSVAIKGQDELSPAAARATDKILMNPTTREERRRRKMTERSDEYRNLAKVADEESQPRMAKIDRRIPDQEILLGLIGHLKVQIFTVAADILDELEKIQTIGLSPTEKTQARIHRLRIASLKGDQETIDRIIQEAVDEATNGNSV